MNEDGARAVLQRFGQFADQFADCFGRSVQRDAASRYLAGLVNDSERKLIGAQVWPTSCERYLPREWAEDADRRDAARVPTSVRFREKWRIALAHIREVIRAGFQIEAVVADADAGTTTGFRAALERMGLRYAVAVRGLLHAWLPGARTAETLEAIGQALPASAWRRVRWGRGTKRPLVARFAARRVRLRHGRGDLWVLFERSLADDTRKYSVLNLDATTSLKPLVRLARSRWPIEEQYRELEDELGLDHFEGRTYPGWTHHVVLTAVAFAFLQSERRRTPDEPTPSLPAVRAWLRQIMALMYVAGNNHLFRLAVSFHENPPLRG